MITTFFPDRITSSQAASIREALAERPTAPADEAATQEEETPPPPPPPQTLPEPEKPQPAGQPNEKSVLNSRVQQVLSKAKLDNQIINQTASLIAKSCGDPKIKQTVYRALIKRHGQKQGLEVYNLVKPLLK